MAMRWDIGYDGVWETDWIEVAPYGHVFHEPGWVSVKAEVRDEFGLAAQAVVSFEVSGTSEESEPEGVEEAPDELFEPQPEGQEERAEEIEGDGAEAGPGPVAGSCAGQCRGNNTRLGIPIQGY